MRVYYNNWQRLTRYSYLFYCGLVFLFLILPILIIIPLSFNVEPYFTFTEKMLSFDPSGYSMRWYDDFFQSDEWIRSVKNSFFIAFFATIVATVFGTVAALGLSRAQMPYRPLIMSILISPLIVPIIISAVGMFFFYAKIGLSNTFLGAILAHAALGTPFVVITVTAALSGFDYDLVRAAKSLGASPQRVFFKVMLPLVTPGVISGALFAFVTSFDEVVVILFIGGFEQKTVTVQMWSGIREQISPTILAVAVLFFLVSVALLTTLELIRRYGERRY